MDESAPATFSYLAAPFLRSGSTIARCVNGEEGGAAWRTNEFWIWLRGSVNIYCSSGSMGPDVDAERAGAAPRR